MVKYDQTLVTTIDDFNTRLGHTMIVSDSMQVGRTMSKIYVLGLYQPLRFECQQSVRGGFPADIMALSASASQCPSSRSCQHPQFQFCNLPLWYPVPYAIL